MNSYLIIYICNLVGSKNKWSEKWKVIKEQGQARKKNSIR